MFDFNGTHARAINDRWAYKISAGGYTSDRVRRGPPARFPTRPTLRIRRFTNQGTTQPKFDATRRLRRAQRRVQADASPAATPAPTASSTPASARSTWTGRRAGLRDGALFARARCKFNFFTNILDGDASALLAVGHDGQPIPFTFNTQTYDFEVGNVNTIGTRQVLSYGGNLRFNNFDLSIAPLGDNRQEFGAYVQDEIFVNDTSA